MHELALAGKLFLSLALGALIGMEREFFRKPAGFRTNILICLGSTLFTIISVELSPGRGDPARIAAQVVTGVGFLGAGAILRENGQVLGLTTAATIWMVASVGVAVGAGFYATAALATAVSLIVLRGFDVLERTVFSRGIARTYRVRAAGRAALEAVEEGMRSGGIHVRGRLLTRAVLYAADRPGQRGASPPMSTRFSGFRST